MSKASRDRAESSLNSWHPWAKNAKPALGEGQEHSSLPAEEEKHGEGRRKAL